MFQEPAEIAKSMAANCNPAVENQKGELQI